MLVAGSTVAEKAPPVLLGVSGPRLFPAPTVSTFLQIRQGFRPSIATPASLSPTPAPLPNPAQILRMLLTPLHEQPPS